MDIFYKKRLDRVGTLTEMYSKLANLQTDSDDSAEPTVDPPTLTSSGLDSVQSLTSLVEQFLGRGSYAYLVQKNDYTNPESHSFSYLRFRTAINFELQKQGRPARRLSGMDQASIDILERIKDLALQVNESFVENNPLPSPNDNISSETAQGAPTESDSEVFEDEDWAYYAAISPGNDRVARWWLQNATNVPGVESSSYSEWLRWAEENGFNENSNSDDIMQILQGVSPSMIGAHSEMQTSEAGIERLRRAEGFRAHVYDDHTGEEVSSYDDIGTGNPTIGYGHLIRDRERDFFSRNLLGATPMTEEEAQELFTSDIRSHEHPWKEQIKVPLSQSMFDALTSYAFNAGGGAPKRDGIVDELNKVNEDGSPAPDYEAAAEAIRNGPQTSNGRLLQGLVRRRNREADEFLSGIPEILATTASPNRIEGLLSLYKQSKVRGMGDERMYKNVDTIKNFGDPSKSEDRKKLETMMADMGLKSLDELSRSERRSFIRAVLGESSRKTKKKNKSKDSAKKRRRRVTSPFRANFDYGERDLRLKENE